MPVSTPTTESGQSAEPILQSTLALCQALIARPSITPEDAGCQALIRARLEPLGFVCRSMPIGKVTNLWAVTEGEGPLLVFAGHTDVVPTGPIELWTSPPFEPVIRDGLLFGRGSADMKGGLAAMVTAAERLLTTTGLKGRLGFLITSDEEGDATQGTKAVVEQLYTEGERIRWCIVGEPSSNELAGDQIRIGRRGSINCTLTVTGKQGHIAYPHLAANPIHLSLQALDALTKLHWDEGNEYFDPTQLQISNIQSGAGVANVIPGDLKAVFNLRFSTEQTMASIRARVEHLFSSYDMPHTLNWQSSGEPFFTQPGTLTSAVCDAINAECGYTPRLSTSGGTSDGRFIAPTGADVVELGPVYATIHQINECCRVQDLSHLSRIYQSIATKLLAGTQNHE